MDKLVLSVLSVHFTLLCVGIVHGTTISSCNQTPYPELCHSLINASPLSSLDGTQFGFRDLMLKVTAEHAKQAHRLVSSMDTSSFDERAKLAWSDCLELYEDTIYQLNRSASSSNPTNVADAQTWLSGAMANHQTCQTGFIEFGLSSHLDSFPSMLGNFSKLLCNSLAVNKAAISLSLSSLKQNGGRKLLSNGGLPTWVSAADRKLLQSSSAASNADLVVAKDGSGNYKTISEALTASTKMRSGTKRFVIYVKKGIYSEHVEVTKSMKNLMLVGDGMGATVITGSKNVVDGSTTFQSATVAVSGDGFMARDITFENTAGAAKHQAVALRVGSDLSVFYSCSIKGYQDTLYVYSQRQFYRNCDIYGTVDFIFGDAVVVLQNCNIYAIKPLSNQQNTITAQGRSDPNENTGIVIHNCQVQSSWKTYLGRPWKEYSRTVFMKTSLDSNIDPAGWLEWSGNFALSTLYYGEYANTRPGSSTSGRVKWAGYHIMTSSDASKFTVGNFLGGDSWIPATGVPYTSGLR